MSKLLDVAERDLSTARDWKMIGIALATAAGAVEAKILAENPELALRALSNRDGLTEVGGGALEPGAAGA